MSERTQEIIGISDDFVRGCVEQIAKRPSYDVWFSYEREESEHDTFEVVDGDLIVTRTISYNLTDILEKEMKEWIDE